MIQLKKLVFDGIRTKQLEIDDIFLDRLSYELSVIEDLNLIEYFLIYSKIIEICNKHGLLRSYGRGSACGSLVNYCLDITKINPLKEGLIFERFVNPAISILADIDIDVPEGSQKLITDQLKIELPEYFVNNLAYIPDNHSNTYKKIVINSVEYRIHPCAILISSNRISLPIADFENETYYVANDFANQRDILDPVKFDLLELENLRKLDLISKQIGPKFHPYNLPLNDKEGKHSVNPALFL